MKLLCLMFFLFFLSACQEPKIQSYQNPNEIQLSSIRWGANDLQLLSKIMVQNILNSNKINREENSIYFFEELRNDTHDQINTKLLKSKITTALTASKRFDFKEDKLATNYLFRGKISSIFKKTNSSKDMFFTFNMTLIDSQTAAIVWSHDVEIRKLYKRSLLGW